MSYHLSVSGHISGENAAGKEQELHRRIKEVVSDPEFGASNATFHGQHVHDDNLHHPDRPPLADAGSWWVTTGPLPAGGEKRAGPYQTQDRAMAARALLERAEGHERYWVDEETASDPAAAPGLAAPDEALVHLVGEEDEEPACWTTDDAPWDTTAWITHNPLKVTCPAPECNPGRTAPGGVS